MNLKLQRKIFTDTSTIGELFIDGVFECYTLEDKDRGLTDAMSVTEIENRKVYGATAIPIGKYEVVLSYSERFKQVMPLLLNVKGFDGIRCHAGNYAENTLGCLLLGQTKGKDFIGQSKVAYQKFLAKLKKVSKTEKIFITIY